jgi:hypothetical protein
VCSARSFSTWSRAGSPAFPHPSFYFRRIEQLREAQVANGDGDRQIWLLEFGWTSDQVHPAYSWFAVSEDQKAQNIVAAYQYARQAWKPWIGVMALSDPTWTPDREEYWWAITDPSGRRGQRTGRSKRHKRLAN